jgi:septum formation protein
VDENIPEGSDPRGAVIDLAFKKAEQVSRDRKFAVVIGADTVVVNNSGDILGKPENKHEAKTMLATLSGKDHSVYTGICIIDKCSGRNFFDVTHTTVSMREITQEEISLYADTEEGLDKAGAYAVQGKGAVFIEKINGDFFNVVGLPVLPISRYLTEVGFPLFSP